MQEICWFLRYFTRKDELLRASSGFDSLWERQNDGYPVVFSFQGIVLSHATALQNPDVRADARLCVQAHHLTIPSLRSLRFPVGTPKSQSIGSFFVGLVLVFLWCDELCFIKHATTYCGGGGG